MKDIVSTRIGIGCFASMPESRMVMDLRGSFYDKIVCNAARQNASAFVSVANESRWTLILAAAQIRGKKRKASISPSPHPAQRKKGIRVNPPLSAIHGINACVMPIRVEPKIHLNKELAKLELN